MNYFLYPYALLLNRYEKACFRFNVDKKCQGTGGNVKEGNLIGGF